MNKTNKNMKNTTIFHQNMMPFYLAYQQLYSAYEKYEGTTLGNADKASVLQDLREEYFHVLQSNDADLIQKTTKEMQNELRDFIEFEGNKKTSQLLDSLKRANSLFSNDNNN